MYGTLGKEYNYMGFEIYRDDLGRWMIHDSSSRYERGNNDIQVIPNTLKQAKEDIKRYHSKRIDF